MKSELILACIVAIGICNAIGCEPQTDADFTVEKIDADNHGHSDHSHDHGDHSHTANNQTDSHDSSHGINGGHTFKFEPGDYRGEWLHYNDNDLIRVFVLAQDGKSNKPVKADKVSVRRSDDAIFTLDPENPDEDGKTATYFLEDKDLTIAMNLGVTIEMKIGDQSFVAKIAPHKPHKH